MFCHDTATQKAKQWTEFHHLLSWTTKFFESLKSNKAILIALELIRGNNEVPIGLAKHHVEEAIGVVSSMLNYDIGLALQHIDTRASNYAANSIMVEDSNGVHELIKQIFVCLYSKCVVRLTVKTNHFYSAALTAFLVDLMYAAGAKSSEIKCLAFDRRESLGSERFAKCPSPCKSSKLSIIAVVMKQTDTFAAAQGIIESYFREQYPNLIILTEESIYDRFIEDWQRYYSHAMFIGPRLDNRTTVVSSVNEKLQIDLAAIDIKAAHKMSGLAINVLKFRTINELLSLLSNLRKIPFMTIWCDDILLSRDFCLKNSICNEFWLNYIPKEIHYRRVCEDMLNYYYETVAEDMANIYNSVIAEFPDEVETLRKMQAGFMKKDARLRSRLVIGAFVSVLNRCKSLKNGSSVECALAKLRRFHQVNSSRFSYSESDHSRVEVYTKFVGLAILLVREENAVKSKPALVELIFQNLIIGNAVLLVCPANTLGAKFELDNDHVIPFKMVHDSMPDISRLTLDTSIEVNDSMNLKKSCPKNTFAIEILPDMNSEAVTVALGCRRKNIWYPNCDQIDYWSNE